MIRLLIEEKEAIRFLSRAVAGCQDSSKPHPLMSELGLPVDDQGRILVDAYLLVRGTSGAWTAGDCAAVPES